tara:strand:- start:224 stop:388 length:165 start_codon:yes stop_codon:yes gene_type:complete
MIVHHRGKIVAIGSHEIIGQKGTVHLLNRYFGGTTPGKDKQDNKEKKDVFFGSH